MKSSRCVVPPNLPKRDHSLIIFFSEAHETTTSSNLLHTAKKPPPATIYNNYDECTHTHACFCHLPKRYNIPCDEEKFAKMEDSKRRKAVPFDAQVVPNLWEPPFQKAGPVPALPQPPVLLSTVIFSAHVCQCPDEPIEARFQRNGKTRDETCPRRSMATLRELHS